MTESIFDRDLGQGPANFTPLTPLDFIARSAAVWPDLPAVVHGDVRRSWAETYARTRRLGSALAGRGIGRGDTVAVIAANIPEMFEAHFGVPMAGAVLNAINTRLDAATVAFILGHGEARVLIVDPEFADVAEAALALLPGREILVVDIVGAGCAGGRAGSGRSVTTTCSRRVIRSSTGGLCRATNGTRSASTTPPGPPAIRRGWSITTGGRR